MDNTETIVIVVVVVAVTLFLTVITSIRAKKKQKAFLEIANTYTKPMLQSVFPDMEYEYNRRFDTKDYNTAGFFDYTHASGHDYVKTMYQNVPIEFNVTMLEYENSDEEGTTSTFTFQGPWIVVRKGWLHSGKITVRPYKKKGLIGKLFGAKEVMTGDPVFDGTYQVYGDENTVHVFLDKNRRDRMVEISKKHSGVYYSFETDQIQVAYATGNILFKSRKIKDVSTVFSNQLNDLLDLINDVVQL